MMELEVSPTNTLGAVIFTGYVLAAVILSASIVHDLLSRQATKAAPAPSNVWVFASMTVLSFSVLSYHMLSFLIDAYETWTWQRQLSLPVAFYGKGGLFGPRGQTTPVHLWTWLSTSSLFRDFAASLCDSHEHFWWTQQALYGNMAWNIYLGIKARQLQLQHLWAYAVISQILPYSFAQNLFFVALLYADKSQPTPVLDLSWWEYAPVMLYLVFVQVTPLLSNTAYLVPCILLVRLLLAWPLLSASVTRSRSAVKRQKEVPPGAAVVGIATANLVCLQTLLTVLYNGSSFLSLLRAVDGAPAVSALGYDYLLSLASAACWYWN